MARLQCQTCAGVYDDLLPDGMRYFHACPPIRVFVDDTGAPIDADTAAAIVKAGGRAFEKTVERPDQRDENVQPTRDRSKPAPMKAEGKGAIEIAPSPTAGYSPVAASAAPLGP